jgi:hypothetical protein
MYVYGDNLGLVIIRTPRASKAQLEERAKTYWYGIYFAELEKAYREAGFGKKGGFMSKSIPIPYDEIKAEAMTLALKTAREEDIAKQKQEEYNVEVQKWTAIQEKRADSFGLPSYAVGISKSGALIGKPVGPPTIKKIG